MVAKVLVEPNQRFFDAVDEVVAALNETHGPLYFAMLLHFPRRPDDEWTLLVGSKKLVAARLNGYNMVARAVDSGLTREFARNIRKLGIVRENDPFVRAVVGAVSKPIGGLAVIENSAIGEIEIERAALYVADESRANGRSGAESRRQRPVLEKRGRQARKRLRGRSRHS